MPRRFNEIAEGHCEYVLYLREKGWTLKDVGQKIGVSTERVRQMEAKGLRYRRELGWRALAAADALSNAGL